MYLSTDASMEGDEVTASDIALLDGTTYYLTCEVTQASPTPTISAAHRGNTPLSATGTGTTASVTAGLLAAYSERTQYMFTAAIATDCSGTMLSCTALNDANTLLNNMDPSNFNTEETITHGIDSVQGQYYIGNTSAKTLYVSTLEHV